jgi:xyloglucan-specific endo-beta-1,4-glucanase
MKVLALFSVLSGLAGAQQLCGQFDYHANYGYEFNNNAWGSGSGSGNQCTYVDKTAYAGVSWHSTWSWSGGQDNVKAYPYSGRQLPQKRIVNQFSSLPSTATWAYSGSNIRANVAYDLFTASNPGHATHSGDYELMIWYIFLPCKNLLIWILTVTTGSEESAVSGLLARTRES